MKAAAAVAAFAACLLPVAAAAQETAAADGQNSGPMTVQQIHNTVLIAPDFKISRLDGTTARIAGVYGGWLLDQQWLVGAGGYWLTNGSGNRGLTYGGGIVGWVSDAERPVAFSARTLIGWGEARLTHTVSFGWDGARDDMGHMLNLPGVTNLPGFGHGPLPLFIDLVPRNYQVRVHQQFFVAEPQADVIFRIASWGRLDAGAGYRAIAASHGDERRIRGATASVSFQVGNF